MYELTVLPGKAVDEEANNRFPDHVINNNYNFYSQNARCLPSGLITVEKALVGEKTERWIEYVPTCYTGQREVPLVLTMHGGGQSDWHQFYTTSWIEVAEKNEVIIVSPNSPKDQLWHAPEGGRAVDPELYEIKYLMALLEEIQKKYKIDKNRIYMQGMSLGDQIQLQFARLYGDMLAGIACCAGPIAPELLFDEKNQPKEYVTSVPVYQYRGEFDRLMFKAGPSCKTRFDLNRANLLFWQKVNDSHKVPEIYLEGADNIAIFKDGEADIVYHDVYQYGHGQTVDAAEFIWNRFFSGLVRGQKHVIDCIESMEKSQTVSAFMLDNSYMYVKGQVRQMDEAKVTPCIVQHKIEMHRASTRFPGMDDPFKGLEFDPCVMVPFSFLRETFSLTEEKCQEGQSIFLTKDGRRIQIAAGSAICMIDGRIWRMESPVMMQDDVLLVPLKWFTYQVFHWHYQQRENVVCISQAYGTLTNDMTLLIQECVTGALK